MKRFSQYIQHLQELLSIYTNPNAYTPPEYKTPEEIRWEKEWEKRVKPSRALHLAAREVLKKMQMKAAITQTPKIKFWGLPGNVAGWWHPKHEIYTFSHDSGYHVTQLVKKPSRFGISQQELQDAFKKESDFYNSRGGVWRDTPEIIKKRIENEDIDLAYEVQRVAYMKGWLKVYSGGTGVPSVEGINRASIRAALLDILLEKPGLVRVDIQEVGLTRNDSKFKSVPATQITNYVRST